MSKTVVSKKQIRANRKNAKKSTGPKSEMGKKQVARNAVKHGLLANQIVLHDNDPQEDPTDFKQLYQDLLDRYEPDGPLEHLLIERIAVCYWRLRRAYRFEVQSIHDLRSGTANPAAKIISQLTGTERNPNQHILPSTSNLDKLLRYESMIDRELNRAMNQLRRLRHRHSFISTAPDGAEACSLRLQRSGTRG